MNNLEIVTFGKVERLKIYSPLRRRLREME